MLFPSLLQRFIAWRWSPCVLLSAASVSFVLGALWLIPGSLAVSRARESAPSLAPVEPAGVPARAPTRAERRAARAANGLAAPAAIPAPAPALPDNHAVGSFFPAAPSPELPPPLEDEPPPPEPPAPAP